jgi:hypothetical protein
MFEAFETHYRESIPPVEADKPGTLVQLAFVNADVTAVDIVRVFSSAEGMDAQLRGADQRSKATYQYIEPTSIEVYGAPSNFALEMIKKVAGSGIAVSIYPQFIGGFIRGST